MAIQLKTLDIELPENLLILMGFSLTAAVGSQAIKSYKVSKPVKDTLGKTVCDERGKPKSMLKELGSEERGKIRETLY